MIVELLFSFCSGGKCMKINSNASFFKWYLDYNIEWMFLLLFSLKFQFIILLRKRKKTHIYNVSNSHLLRTNVTDRLQSGAYVRIGSCHLPSIKANQNMLCIFILAIHLNPKLATTMSHSFVWVLFVRF